MLIRNFLATIAASGTTSGAVDLGHATLCGIYVPSSFTGTALTFTASETADGTFAPVKDGAGAAVSKTVAAGDYIYLDPVILAGVRFLKIVSGSTEGAARELTLAARVV
jgi:hypothetical protein